MRGRKKCLDKPQIFKKGMGNRANIKRTPVADAEIPGNDVPSCTPYLRLSRGLYDQSATAERGVPCLYDRRGRSLATRILRPRSVLKAKSNDGSKDSRNRSRELNSNRIFHYGKTEELWNTAIAGHRSYSPRCRGPLQWDIQAEQQWGLGWLEKLHCPDCGYRSPMTKVFNEVEGKQRRGRKSGASNRALQVGLSHCMIGNTAMRDLLLTMNIPAPSASAMQYQLNSVGPVLVQVNKNDMASRLKNLAHSSSSIMVEGDCRYNNPLRTAAGKTPYQPATQAVYTVCENMTDQKQVLAIVCKNKLCRVAELLRKDGHQVTCPDHDGHCSADLQPDDPIGDEGTWASEAFRDMFSSCESVSFDYFTTDGDSRAFKGLLQVQGEYSSVVPEHLRDTRHLMENLRYAIKAASFTSHMFPWKEARQREKLQDFFAMEFSRRCNSEVEACHKLYKGNIEKIQEAMKPVPETLIRCFEGDCSQCNEYSFLCGSEKERKWIRTYLPQDFQIYPTEEDEKKLLKIVNIRLSEDSLWKTRFNTSTQKSEAVNRTLSRVNPKCVTYKRNFKGLIHSGTHLLNSGIADSTSKKCAAVGAPLSTGSRVMRQLEQQDKREKYIRMKMRSASYRSSRRQRRQSRYSQYLKKMEEIHYKKGLLSDPTHGHDDHPYSTRRTRTTRTSDGKYPSTSRIQTRSQGRKRTRKN